MNFGRVPDKRCRECPVVGYRSQERLSASARRVSPWCAVGSGAVGEAGGRGPRGRGRTARRSPVGAHGDRAPRLGYAGLRAAEVASAAPGGRGGDGRPPAGAGSARVPVGVHRPAGPLARVRAETPRRHGHRGGRVGFSALGSLGSLGALRDEAGGACRPTPYGPAHDGPGGHGRTPGPCGREGADGRNGPVRGGRAASPCAVLGGGGPGSAADAGATGARSRGGAGPRERGARGVWCHGVSPGPAREGAWRIPVAPGHTRGRGPARCRAPRGG